MSDEKSNKTGVPKTKLGSLTTSQIGFGCMGITAFYGAPMEDDQALILLKSVYDNGVTMFDTAEIYRSGNPMQPTADTKYNEVILGKFVQTVPRDSVLVATKFHPALHGGKVDAASVESAVDDSLKRLGLQYIDLYYCHRTPGSLEALLEWMASAKRLVEKGKIKHIGLSEVSGAWLAKAHEVHPVTAVQQEWSLLTRNLEEELVPMCAKLGVGIVAYSPLARNLLVAKVETTPKDWRASNPRYSEENLKRNQEITAQVAALAKAKSRTAAQLSLAWLYNKAKALGVVVVPIPGTTKVAHVADNLGGVGVELSAAEVAQLEALAANVAGARGNEQYLQAGIEAQAAAKK